MPTVLCTTIDSLVDVLLKKKNVSLFWPGTLSWKLVHLARISMPCMSSFSMIFVLPPGLVPLMRSGNICHAKVFYFYWKSLWQRSLPYYVPQLKFSTSVVSQLGLRPCELNTLPTNSIYILPHRLRIVSFTYLWFRFLCRNNSHYGCGTTSLSLWGVNCREKQMP